MARTACTRPFCDAKLLQLCGLYRSQQRGMIKVNIFSRSVARILTLSAIRKHAHVSQLDTLHDTSNDEMAYRCSQPASQPQSERCRPPLPKPKGLSAHKTG